MNVSQVDVCRYSSLPGRVDLEMSFSAVKNPGLVMTEQTNGVAFEFGGRRGLFPWNNIDRVLYEDEAPKAAPKAGK